MSGLRTVIREDSVSAGGCCALCSSAALRVAATPKMLPAARLRTQSRESRCIESAVILASCRRQVSAPRQLVLALRLYLVHRRLYSSTILVADFQMQKLASFGMGIYSSRPSFPRKRESSPASTFPKVCRVDSRFRGNDCAPNDTTPQLGEAEWEMREFQRSLSENGSPRLQYALSVICEG